jgi:hypothetical protein
MSVLDGLRSGCPARKTDEPVDVEVAVKLVENRDLYRRALDRAHRWPTNDRLRKSHTDVPCAICGLNAAGG